MLSGNKMADTTTFSPFTVLTHTRPIHLGEKMVLKVPYGRDNIIQRPKQTLYKEKMNSLQVVRRKF